MPAVFRNTERSGDFPPRWQELKCFALGQILPRRISQDQFRGGETRYAVAMIANHGLQVLQRAIDDAIQILLDAGESGNADIRIQQVMVLNHTSDEHRWFQESRKSKENPYRDYYVWRPAKADGSEPNNWGNYFYEGRGSAWEWDDTTKEYYLHNYSKHMPDLNWDCKALREDIYSMLNWWCDLGIDGFRLDAINRLQKPQGLPDSTRPCALPINPYGYIVDREMCANQPGIHDLLKDLNAHIFALISSLSGYNLHGFIQMML